MDDTDDNDYKRNKAQQQFDALVSIVEARRNFIAFV